MSDSGNPGITDDVDALWRAARLFDDATRKRGEQYFRNDSILTLKLSEDGQTCTAQVEGGNLYTTKLINDDGETITDCTCPVGVDCKHAYAVLLMLISRIKKVRESDSPRSPAPGKRRDEFRDVKGELKQALGRAFDHREKNLLRRLNEVYRRNRGSASICGWEAQNLGLPTPDGYYVRFEMGPKPSTSFREFLSLIVYAIRANGGKPEPLLEPVADTMPIEETMRKWRRRRTIKEWRHILDELVDDMRDTSRSSEPAPELRLRIGRDEAQLEWRRAGAEKFARMSANAMMGLIADGATTRLDADPGMLLSLLDSGDSYNPARSRLRFDIPGDLALFNVLLRMESMRPLLVTADGSAVRFHDETLRWKTEVIRNDDGTLDYRLALTGAKGDPAPEVWLALDGLPALYVTPEGVFPGPPPAKCLPARNEVSIPSEVVESRGGVELLETVGAELPARLAKRVERVPVEVVIKCRLESGGPASKSEYCVVSVNAKSRDGAIDLEWYGSGWNEQGRAKPDPKPGVKPSKTIPIYDRGRLAAVPGWLAGLPLRNSTAVPGQSMRVTRDFVPTFVGWLKSLPAHACVELYGELKSLTDADVSGSVSLEIEESGTDWFDLSVVVDVSDTTLTQEEIRLLLNARGSFVRLHGKGWRRLAFDFTEEDDEQLARLGLGARELSAEPQKLHALQLADNAAGRFLPSEQVERVRRRASELKARVTPDVPASIRADLRPYQTDGFHFLAYISENNFGGVLADDMGLGKTLQTLVWLAWLRGRANGKPAGPSLVVCPKSVMDNWRAETARFAPGISTRVWSARELKKFEPGAADLHVVNYSQLRLAADALTTVDWHAAILDEGQYIKNPQSATAQTARDLKAAHRLVLTGTPIENRLMDLWSLMAFAMPGALGSKTAFSRLYDAKGDPLARKRLASRVRPFLLRRTKSQVAADLPDRVEEDLYCELSGEQDKLYRAELKRARQMLLKVKTQKELAKQRFHFLTSLLRLRQISCHPALVKSDSRAKSAKAEALIEQLETLLDEGEKALVFSQFVEMIGLLKPELESRGWPVFVLTGDTEKRGELVERFQSTEGPAVFLISLKAGGSGLNLTAASYVFLFDPWWNPAVESQAIDRTHRIGQTRKVMAYRLLIKNSVEEKIRELQKSKQSLSEDVLGEERFSESLTMDDLKYLLA